LPTSGNGGRRYSVLAIRENLYSHIWTTVPAAAAALSRNYRVPRIATVWLKVYDPRLETIVMPGKKHLRGVSTKEQRQYEHIKQSAERSGRYGARAKEVAARTVLKQHKTAHHRKGQ